MEKINIKNIIEAIQGKVLNPGIDINITKIFIDSRKTEVGSLFIAIKGERLDGHDFIKNAIKAGAKAIIVHKEIDNMPKDIWVIKVDDTTKALGLLAKWYKNLFNIIMIGVTGSVGKTTTREMIGCVLSQKYVTLKNEKNYNNHIGVPLTLFNLNKSTEAAVIEMGMSEFGEIEYLTKMINPEISLITNIGVSHIEKLGSRENILRSKMEIVKGMNPDGILIVNGDDSLLSGIKGIQGYKTITYGLDESNDVYARSVVNIGQNKIRVDMCYGGSCVEMTVPAPGIHNAYNALAATTVGIVKGMRLKEIAEGLINYKPEEMRLNISNIGDLTIINDTYNSAPDSLKAGIGVLCSLEGNYKIAVLGDMLELGEWSEKLHREIGEFLALKKIDYIITVGDNAKYIAKAAIEEGLYKENIWCFDTNIEATDKMLEISSKGDCVLIKGSRGMHMEEIIDRINLKIEK